jgi:hypothetical protein
MVSVSTWTTPEIDARIVELKQKGVSHTQIAVAICHEFDVFVNKNMVLRRARTILGIDRGEKAANERLERRRAAEKAAREPKAPRPVNVPAPVVTLPPLASVAERALNELVTQAQEMGFYELPRPVPPPVAAPLGNGKCLYPLWKDNEPPTHRYCDKRTPLGSSFCPDCRRVCFYRARAA